jgi:hypothetical protein
MADIDFQLVVDIVELAGEAAALASASDAAYQARIGAEADLLGRLMAAVRPVVRSVSSKRVEFFRGQAHGAEARSDQTADRVLILEGDAEPKRCKLSEHNGKYVGKALWLSESGIFYHVAYSGEWGPAVDYWQATRYALVGDAVVAEFSLVAIAESMHEALVRYVDGAVAKTTVKNRERAKLAIEAAALLGGGK